MNAHAVKLLHRQFVWSLRETGVAHPIILLPWFRRKPEALLRGAFENVGTHDAPRSQFVVAAFDEIAGYLFLHRSLAQEGAESS